MSSYNSSGFNLGSAPQINNANDTYVSWTFRKAPKFFDVVTYTGNGVAGRQIAHSLGVAPGMMIVKRTDSSTAGNWYVYHRSTGNTGQLYLEQIVAFEANANTWANTSPTATEFTVGSNPNLNNATYVAYLFAHDTASDGLIQCGSFTTDGSGNATVTLGWEPQWWVMKASSGGGGNWIVNDVMRGWSQSELNYVSANLSNAEGTGANPGRFITSTGVAVTGLSASTTYIYLAIRRPNKPPTVGTQVYNAIARTGTGAAATVTGVGFAPDYLFIKRRDSGDSSTQFDRLRGVAAEFDVTSTGAEITSTRLTSFGMDGFVLGTGNNTNINGGTFINHCFKRAPGVFDVVCYTGNSNTPFAKQTLSHNLQVSPELVIWKSRSSSYSWRVFSLFTDSGYATNILNSSEQSGSASYSQEILVTARPTISSIQVGNFNQAPPYALNMNELGVTYIAYLFATKAGISKVGSYTGNGSTQTINCGFTTGARFILIKRTDSTGDWYVWDTTRGIVAGNDPHLSLNTTAAEVTTDDSIDADNSGFVVNQVAATNINVNAGTYIFLAFA